MSSIPVQVASELAACSSRTAPQLRDGGIGPNPWARCAACVALHPLRALSRPNRYLSRVCEGAPPCERPVRRRLALHRFPPRRGPIRMKTSGLERIGILAVLGQPAKRPARSCPAEAVFRAFRPRGHGRRLPNGRRRADPLVAAINRDHDGRQPTEGVRPTAHALHRRPSRAHRRSLPRPPRQPAGHRAKQPTPIGS